MDSFYDKYDLNDIFLMNVWVCEQHCCHQGIKKPPLSVALLQIL
jgi:hypothetical protein